MKQKKEILVVCNECGISANVITCLERHGVPPNKLAFSISTFHKGRCGYCGKIKMVTEVRDFYYPDFSLLIKYKK